MDLSPGYLNKLPLSVTRLTTALAGSDRMHSIPIDILETFDRGRSPFGSPEKTNCEIERHLRFVAASRQTAIRHFIKGSHSISVFIS
jgi:hypothetical protein